eukprot:9474478-Pyramimonas_sp.AAC.2
MWLQRRSVLDPAACSVRRTAGQCYGVRCVMCVPHFVDAWARAGGPHADQGRQDPGQPQVEAARKHLPCWVSPLV